MFLSLSLILLGGLIIGSIFQKLKIPKIIGMILVGIIIGPYTLNLIDGSILDISSEIRKIALVIILIKAGLTVKISDLKKVGLGAILMSFVPASFEILAYALLAPLLLNISIVDAILMGAVLAAVSPAIVVPRMVNLIEKGYGTKKGIPQMILAGSSFDDIFVIVVFTTFLSISKDNVFNASSLLNLPISITLGVLIGIICGIILLGLFKVYSNEVVRIILMLGFSFALISFEKYINISSLLGIIIMASVVKLKEEDKNTQKLSSIVGKMWIIAEIFLFVLVGASVDTSFLLLAGFPTVLLILLALVVRSMGVYVCLIGSKLSFKEKMFCIISYLPKATVQAAIASIPLSVGIASGQNILIVAVLGIFISAPLGALGIDLTYKKFLEKC